ncbi:Aste57867_3938 [Aphanomyces stellatus]|uniref:Aste57867_3938 protein n=1 Tax=Aphanomyces stellatus TaxID=120398 RepID=A0A485KAM3_9STRA|nr:hypothetical protein As57867_003927 [Aphanomyces stellatus]VFT81075.1 Aste57867_3938 [Aphanomyces stellatus]
MESRQLYEVKALRTHRVTIARRPKSAHISHKGELVLGLSPRANRASFGVSDSPTKYQHETRSRVAVQRYCVLDLTTPPDEPLAPSVDSNPPLTSADRSFKCKVTRAGQLLPRAASRSTLGLSLSKSMLGSSTSRSELLEPTAQKAAWTESAKTSSTTSSKPDAVVVSEPPPSDPPPLTMRLEKTTDGAVDGSKPPTAAQCLSVHHARKQAEASAVLLANRLSFLHMERTRATQEAERLHIEYCREQEAKLAFERQKLERQRRGEQERQRVAEKHCQAVALQSQNRTNIQQQQHVLAQQKRQAAQRVKDQQLALEEDKKAREASMMEAKMKTKHSVASHHERAKRQRQMREKLNREKLARAQAERLKREMERERMAKHLVAKMQAQENSLKSMLEFQEHQQRIEMQRCFDMESCVVPDQIT